MNFGGVMAWYFCPITTQQRTQPRSGNDIIYKFYDCLGVLTALFRINYKIYINYDRQLAAVAIACDDVSRQQGKGKSLEDDERDTLISFLARPTGRAGVDRALREIVLGIVTGRYQPGEKLNANKIIKEIDVGLVPVREALHLLAGQGVIDLLPQKGARVKGMSRHETEEWHEIFRVLTLIGIRKAAQLLREQPKLQIPLAEARAVVARLPSEEANPQIATALLEFHRRVNAFAGSELLDEASRRLQVVHWISFVAQYASLVPHRVAIMENYFRLADALGRGDSDSAVAAYNYQCAFLSALIRGEKPDIETSWIRNTQF
jgi:DNA-binding GntR family transcriptional regulator